MPSASARLPKRSATGVVQWFVTAAAKSRPPTRPTAAPTTTARPTWDSTSRSQPFSRGRCPSRVSATNRATNGAARPSFSPLSIRSTR